MKSTAKVTVLNLLICFSIISTQATAQRRSREISNPSVSIEYVHYRPVMYETEKVIEIQNERKNEGGLVFVYIKNISNVSIFVTPIFKFFSKEGYKKASMLLIFSKLRFL